MASIRAVRSIGDMPIEGLCAGLIDAVDNGASIGFLSPLTRDTARAYWDEVTALLGKNLYLWIAEAGDEVVGSVQLVACPKHNGRHRGEVQKLFVRSHRRGRGIGLALMRELESAAPSLGLSLLVLDTETGSPAEALYRKLGWNRTGEIPDYASRPDGVLHPTTYYYKLISR